MPPSPDTPTGISRVAARLPVAVMTAATALRPGTITVTAGIAPAAGGGGADRPNSRTSKMATAAMTRPAATARRCRDCTDLILGRSEEHTSELQSLMRNSYAVFCLKKKKKQH